MTVRIDLESKWMYRMKPIVYYQNANDVLDKMTCKMNFEAVIFDSNNDPIGYKNEFKALQTDVVLNNPIGYRMGVSSEFLDMKYFYTNTDEIHNNIIYINHYKLLIQGAYFEENSQLYLCEILEA